MLKALHRLFQRGNTTEEEAPQEQAPAAPTRIRPRPNPGTRILIVDDSKTTQALLGRLLSQHGYETLAAYDGESGLAMAVSHLPALVMMDVVMPGITGFQATRRLRKHPDPLVAHIPVIIMSGNQQATEQFWSVKIGANDFMVKPFESGDVLDRIERALWPNARQELA